MLAPVALALPDVVHHTGPVDVVICDGAPYNRAMVHRAMRFWLDRCLYEEMGSVYNAECGPFPVDGQSFLAPANTIVITQHEPEYDTMAGATMTMYSLAGPLSIIRFDHVAARRMWPLFASDRWKLLLHELGHALAFDSETFHHSEPGTVMAPGLDSIGLSTVGLDQCR